MIGILGPEGTGKKGIAGLPLLINTDLRSYYAIGSPDSNEEPVVDYRGGIIPIAGSYTLIFGTLIRDKVFYSSEIGVVKVELHEDGFPIVTVTWEVDGDIILFNLFSDKEDEDEVMVINVVRGFSNHQLLITLCPIDQEGLTTVEKLEYDNKHNILHVTNHPDIYISETPIQSTVSALKDGHAGKLIQLSKSVSNNCDCKAKAASWAASFPVRATPDFILPLNSVSEDFDIDNAPDIDDIEYKWEDILDEFPEIKTSNKDVDYFFKTSGLVLRLLLDVSRSCIPIGPSLQEDVWLPSLVFQTIALDRLGFSDLIVRDTLNKLLSEVDSSGVIAKGKQWDGQGALILSVLTHYQYTHDKDWIGEKYSILKRIADWVIRQSKKTNDDPLISGLLSQGTPSWFNELYWEFGYYYFNNFWALSILKNISIIAKELGKHGDSDKFLIELDNFKENIDNSISLVSEDKPYLPAGPYRKDSTEMVFILHAFYPLKLYNSSYQPILNSFNHLWENYVFDGGILIDQPWNSYGTYLSILMAQAARYIGKMECVEEVLDFMIKYPTNRQGWAEGISPQTLMGSVGDSPNGYAAAEFVNLIFDLFVEDSWQEPMVLLKGMPKSWLEKGVKASNIQLLSGTKLDIEANLNKDILSVKWEIKTPSNKLLPLLYFGKSTEKNLRQISQNLFELPGQLGEININYS